MRRKIIYIFAVLCSLQLQVNAQSTDRELAVTTSLEDADGLLQPLEPTCFDGVLTSPPWSGNWFVTLSGGATAFLGTPLGCNDLFGRIQPVYHVAVGKWFTPAIGARIDYQGMWLRDCQSANQNYHYVHADLMWNLLGRRYGRQEQVRWNLSPFLGAGVLHNATLGSNPFAFSYGLQGEYNISRRVSFVMELSGMTTFQDFDGYGKVNRLGDNMLTLTAGFSFRLGKVGWKKVVDANPYMRQNKWLIDYTNSLAERNRRYAGRHERDERTMAELKKILEIEGVLDKYGHLFDQDSVVKTSFPRNDYSGLNSLRARLKNRHWDGRSALIETQTGNGDGRQDGRNGRSAAEDDGVASTIHSWQADSDRGEADYGALEASQWLAHIDEKSCIGSPIYFFFRLGTDRLTDASQTLNLDELARVAKQHGLHLKVVGAADSATGTAAMNDTLSRARADFIVAALLERGIPAASIHAVSHGGINDYSPAEANRHTRVELHFPTVNDTTE